MVNESKAFILIDKIFLPSLSLAFEYNGEYHYKFIAMYLSMLPCVLMNRSYFSSKVKERDEKKKDWCQQAGITLINVPFWWDRKVETLITAIQLARPDIKLFSNLDLVMS